MGNIVGAKKNEVVVMNSLTVNIHLMMISFYNPTPQRYKIIIDHNAFPSDKYAIISHLEKQGFGPEALI